MKSSNLTKKLSLLLLVVALVSNVYSEASTPPANMVSTDFNRSGGPTPKQLFELLQQMTGITEADFCNCFPSLCCICVEWSEGMLKKIINLVLQIQAYSYLKDVVLELRMK